MRLGSGIDQVHKNGNDVQPRLGVIWNPTGNGDLAVRGAYAVMINQTNTGYVGRPARNPPLAVPLNVAGNVTLENAFATAQASGLAPTTTNPDFQPGRMQTWNVNVEKELGATGVMIGYFGSYGDRLRIPVNINQFVNGVRPYPRLSTTSPISPGATLGNITEVQSAGLVALQGALDHGEPPDVEGPAGRARRTRCRSPPTPTRTTPPAPTATGRCRTATTWPTAKGRRTSTRGIASASTARTSCRSTATASWTAGR